MENNTPPQPTPTPEVQQAQPISPQSPVQPKSKRLLFWIVSAMLTTLAVLFTPLPYHQNETICTLSLPGDCITSGWKLGPSLFTKMFGQINSQALRSKCDPQTKCLTEPKPTIATPTPTPNLYTEGTRSATVNWQTYTSSKAHFSIQYPSDWNENEGGGAYSNGPSKIVLSGPEGIIHIRWGTTKWNMEPIVECEKEYTKIEAKNTSLLVCDIGIQADGTRKWDPIKTEIKTSPLIAARVTINTPLKENQLIILKILSTFTFTQ